MKNDRERPARAIDPRAAGPAGGSSPRTIDSRMLLGAGREIRIRHNGAVYTLRQTRQDKLILTK
jgi:hemin uptake protein HemP